MHLSKIRLLAVFRAQPPCPPSQAQAAAVNSELRQSLRKTVFHFFRHRGFLLLFLSYGWLHREHLRANLKLVDAGVIAGVFYAYSTLLNNIVLQYDHFQVGYIAIWILLVNTVHS